MGVVVQLNDYRGQVTKAVKSAANSFVPIEFAVGDSDRERCLKKLADHGLESIHVRRLKNDPDSLIHLLSVQDAQRLNMRILEKDELSDDAIEKHIDIIQMLENLDLNMLESLWAAFTESKDAADSSI